MNQPRSLTGFLALHPLFIGLILVPVCLVVAGNFPAEKRSIFVLSLLALIPLAALISVSTEQIAARVGNNIGGLLNATLGNMTELVIAVAALHAGQYDLVKAAVAGAIITNALFLLGGAFLWGGLKHHVQQINLEYVHMQSGLMLLAAIALLLPSAIHMTGSEGKTLALQPLSTSLSVLLLAVYLLGLFFSIHTHSDLIEKRKSVRVNESSMWPLRWALLTLLVATLALGFVSEVFVNSTEFAAIELGLSPTFVGFILVAMAGSVAELFAAMHAAQNDRMDLAIAIAMGSTTQIALFLAPVLVLFSYVIGPHPMSLLFSGETVLMVFMSAIAIGTIVSGKRTTWYAGVLLLAIYLIFAVTMYHMPP